MEISVFLQHATAERKKKKTSTSAQEALGYFMSQLWKQAKILGQMELILYVLRW